MKTKMNGKNKKTSNKVAPVEDTATKVPTPATPVQEATITTGGTKTETSTMTDTVFDPVTKTYKLITTTTIKTINIIDPAKMNAKSNHKLGTKTLDNKNQTITSEIPVATTTLSSDEMNETIQSFVKKGLSK